MTFLLARDRPAVRRTADEGVTSGSMEVDDKAKLAEGEAETDGHGDPERAVERRPPEDLGSEHPLPDADACPHVLEKMTLIRRFEERAGERDAKAKIGG